MTHRSSASADARDSLTGAGAAPGGRRPQPRACSRRGKHDQRTPQFYASLKQVPPISARRGGRQLHKTVPPSRILVQGEFRGMARWVASAAARRQPSQIGERQSLPPDTGHGAGYFGDDFEGLAGLLTAIADDVQSRAAIARTGVVADFAGRVAHARKHFPRSLIASTLATIQEQRLVALAAVNRNANTELAGRREAAISRFRRRTLHKSVSGCGDNSKM